MMSELHGDRGYEQWQIELEGLADFETTHENMGVFLHSPPLQDRDHWYLILSGATMQQRYQQSAEAEIIGEGSKSVYIFREKIEKIASGLFNTITLGMQKSGYFVQQKPWVAECDEEAYIKMSMSDVSDVIPEGWE
jgi:hypothetical protein